MQPRQKIFAGKDMVKVAIIQTSPIFMDKEKSLAKACEKIIEAGKEGAELIVFSETWIAGYPYWDEGWSADGHAFFEARNMFFDNSIIIPSEDTERLCAAAAKANAYVVIGCNELDPRPNVQTIYNSLLFIDFNGKVMGKHRKLVATYVERAFWGGGDGSDMQVYETDIGRIGGLICGEHTMTLARYRMIEQGEDFHVSVFPGCYSIVKGPRLQELDDGSDFMGNILCRAHALEGGAFGILASGYFDAATIPEDFPFDNTLNYEYADGGSCVISPAGSYVTPPTFGDSIIYATCTAGSIKVRKAIQDTLGHYSRFDVLNLDYRYNPVQQVTETLEITQRDVLERIAEKHDISWETLEEAIKDYRKGICSVNSIEK